ncbi:hypothetical protein [Vibrio intestinalis]|uniref:hypothetical protein n=1 Tax=Vibrio intestinalis TaxID=2933291 RepID=UPI0021A43278|nr:hypothetical protein [Vibrio intestinalis]
MKVHIFSTSARHAIARSLLYSALAFLVAVPITSKAMAAQDYAIFALDSEFESLSVNKARKLYRGKTKRLDGKKVELSDWPEQSQERTDFYQFLLGKNSAQMNAHWASLTFSGKARPPRELADAEVDALLRWMKEKPNRIGYAPVESLPNDANILFVVEGEK